MVEQVNKPYVCMAICYTCTKCDKQELVEFSVPLDEDVHEEDLEYWIPDGWQYKDGSYYCKRCVRLGDL